LEAGKRTHLQAAQEAWEVAAGYLTEVHGDLTQVRLGEANERAAGIGSPRRRGGCDTQGAREGGDADVLRRGRHLLLFPCFVLGLGIHFFQSRLVQSCCRMGRAHGPRLLYRLIYLINKLVRHKYFKIEEISFKKLNTYLCTNFSKLKCLFYGDEIP
jgi:hypothetical protein